MLVKKINGLFAGMLLLTSTLLGGLKKPLDPYSEERLDAAAREIKEQEAAEGTAKEQMQTEKEQHEMHERFKFLAADGKEQQKILDKKAKVQKKDQAYFERRGNWSSFLDKIKALFEKGATTTKD